ncbi:hypothetical protein E8E12_007546 [Didymella heteroderae]|uniref:Uncharacterized protein n=1 Tax=Didymella heteroderae TaxID=1769908 RepID=A0A9P4WKX9_9PLEO|nr:hypothetical protein E8E12_007546 [Didymella heteroderae]
MTRFSTAAAPVQVLQSDSAQSTITPQSPITLQASMDASLMLNNAREVAITMSDLQEQIRYLKASVDDLVASAASAPPSGGSGKADDHRFSLKDVSFAETEPRSILSSKTPLASVDELEERPNLLYTIQGAERDHPLYVCSHCAPGDILVPEELFEEMQRKIKDIAERGTKAVQGRMEDRQQLGIAKKQYAQLAKTMNGNNDNSMVAEKRMHQLASKAEKEKSIAEQVYQNMLEHLNASLWEVAALKLRLASAEIRVQDLEHQQQVLLTSKEEELTALRQRIAAADEATESEHRDLDYQKSLFDSAGRQREDQIKYESDARTASVREIETLLTNMREIDSQLRNSVSMNNRLGAEIQAVTSRDRRLREVENLYAALQAARSGDAIRMGALQRRNAYLEERLGVYEESVMNRVSFLENVTTTFKGQGQRWGFGSLQGLRRRREDEEERVSLEYLV